MKCSQCGRRGQANRLSCLYCGGAVLKSDRIQPLQCSRCQSPMREVTQHGVTIDVCTTCKAIWFDAGELEALVAAPPAGRTLATRKADMGPQHYLHEMASTEGKRLCPICSAAMAQRHHKPYSGVIIDVCPNHGVFLDPMEFEKIQRFNARAHARREVHQAKQSSNTKTPKKSALLRRTKFDDPSASNNAINQNDAQLWDAVILLFSALF